MILSRLEILDLVSAFKNIGLGLGAPGAGPANQLLPLQSDGPAPITGPFRSGFWGWVSRVMDEWLSGGSGTGGSVKGEKNWLLRGKE